MREVVIGGAGLLAGGVIGAGGLLVVQLVLGGTVLATMALMAPEPDAIADAPAAVATAGVAGEAPAPVQKSKGVGELQLITLAAVQVMVDGGPIDFDPQQGYLTTLNAGQHRVQILNLVGAPIVDQVVEIAADQRTQLRYANKVLTDQGRMPMRGAANPTVAGAPTAGAPVVVVPAVDIEPVAVELPQVPVVTVDPAAAGDPEGPSLTIGAGPVNVKVPVKIPGLTGVKIGVPGLGKGGK
jgi:hypothetical protein